MGEVIQDPVNATTHRLAPTEPVKEMALPFHGIDARRSRDPTELSGPLWWLLALPRRVNTEVELLIRHAGPVWSSNKNCRAICPANGVGREPRLFLCCYRAGCDLIELLLREGVDLPAHPLEEFIKPKDIPKTAPPGSEERTSVGVYVDDYVLGVVENDDRSLIRRVSRATLHAIHSISPPHNSSSQRHVHALE